MVQMVASRNTSHLNWYDQIPWPVHARCLTRCTGGIIRALHALLALLSVCTPVHRPNDRNTAAVSSAMYVPVLRPLLFAGLKMRTCVMQDMMLYLIVAKAHQVQQTHWLATW